MKKVLTATAAALIAFTGAASAMTADTVSGLDRAQIRQYAPNIDLSLVDVSAVKLAVDLIEEHEDESHAFIQNVVRTTLEKGL
ncbi:hypothetical protein [Thalassobius sp. MITS945101]|uniref:hypothetical protein n=1 Tax=Thalassobius sp. MITS945101 TaxID=3096994 RepID=UPI00399AAFB3